MATKVRTGMVETGFATEAALTALRSIFVGTVHEFPFVPTDPWWIPLFGQTLTTASYPALAAKFGIVAPTFTLPDDRGRVVAGVDNMGGTSANRLTNQSGGLNGDVLGATGGAETHVLTIAQLAAHTHAGMTDTDGAHSHAQQGSGSPGAVTTAKYETALTAGAPQATQTATDGPHAHHFTTNSTGSGGAHNNVQPTITRYKCILAY